MRRWLSVACYACCVAALTACGDDDGMEPDASVTDGGPGATDGAMDAGRDGSVDPCAGRTLCESAGSSCDGDTLVTCAADADGCLVATRAGCGDEVCAVDDGAAACVDRCSLVPEAQRCDAPSRDCDGDVLEVCALVDGCLVRTDTDCAEAAEDGFCNPEGGASGDMAACDIPGDPCEGVTQCDPTASPPACADRTTLTTCAADVFGCFVASSTDCAATGEVCDDTGATPLCVDACAAVETCAAPTSCAGADLVVCAPNADGCLVETRRQTCDTSCGTTGGAPGCIDPQCPGIVQAIELDCSSGTVSGNTAGGTTAFTGTSNACTGGSYPGPERAYRFVNRGGPAAVSIVATVPSTGDFDLFVLARSTTGQLCTDEGLTCLGSSTGTGSTERVDFALAADEVAYVVYDIFSSSTATGSFTLDVTCTPIVCGDGVIGGTERCDDGNTSPGDGCSATCQVEPGFGCTGTPSVCAPQAPNATCASGTPVSGDDVLSGENLAIGGPRPTGTSCGTSGGPALYYAVTIPPSTSVTAVATRGTATDLVLTAQDTCGAAACSAFSDTPERLTLSNFGATAVTRYLGVHSFGSSVAGTFDLAFTYAALAPNASCATATPITGNDSITGESTPLGGPRPAGTGCASNTTGNGALYYAVTVPPSSYADVTTTSTLDRVMVFQDACDATSCTYYTDTAPERGQINNTTSAPITRYVAIHPWSSTGSGTFDVQFTYVPYIAGGTCETATPVSGNDIFTDQVTTGGGPRPAGTGCASVTTGNGTRYYAVTIPPGQLVDVITSTPTMSFDRVLVVRDSCSANSCSFFTDLQPERAQLANATSSPITRYVAIHPFAASGSGTFDVEFRYTPIVPGGTCETATAVTGTDAFTGVSTVGGGPRPAGTGCFGTTAGNGTQFYAVTVPAGQAVEVVTAGSLDRVMVFQDACGATSCSFLTNTSPERGRIANPTSSPITRYVAIHPASATASGTFDVQFNYTALATNATCAGATVVTGTDIITGENLAVGGPRPSGEGCGTGTTQAQSHALYYSVVIPPQTRVEVLTDSTIDRVLLVQDSCSAPTCSLRTDTAPERATLRNDSTSASLTRVIAIHPFSVITGTWNVSFTYHPYACGNGIVEGSETCDDGNTTDGDGCSATCATEPGSACVGAPSVCVAAAPNAFCGAAAVITSNDLLSGESTAAGGPRPSGTGCATGGGLRTLYYAVTVPPGQQVLAQTANITGDITLFTLNGCGDAACASSTNAAPERALISNTTSAPVTRFIGVHSASATTQATFDIQFTYANGFTSIPVACVDASAGTLLTSGDDETSAAAALPFPFRFFGTDVTRYRASTNGFFMVGASDPPTESAAGNQLIPNTSTPNGVVAPFWDDLVLSRSGAGVRTLTTGTAGSRRFVVEWSGAHGYLFSGGDEGVNLRFQAHLVEGTNAVELHYCSMTNSGTSQRHTGSSATIGLENSTGTNAIAFSYDTAGVVTTGSALRYTP